MRILITLGILATALTIVLMRDDIPVGGVDKIQELVAVQQIAKVKQGDNFIEVVSVSPIEGGIEVLARAWDKNNQPIGFGDGSVEIERFRIINPPIYVPDSNGEKTVKGKVNTRYTKNPEKAILRTLERTIEKKAEKHTGERIVKNKVGNTTTTVYPAAGANSPVDGMVARVLSAGDGVSWATLRDGAGTLADTTDTGIRVTLRIEAGAYREIRRSIILFDTSSIPDTDTISSATLTVNSDGKSTAGNIDIAHNVYSSTPASDSTLATTDYANVGTTAFSTEVAQGSWPAAGTDVDFVLNASGISNISLTGNSKFGLRESNWDATNTDPGTVGFNGTDEAYSKSADVVGTTNDPQLVVEHSAAGAGGSNSGAAVLMGTFF